MNDVARPTRARSAVPQSSPTGAIGLLIGLTLADFVGHMLVSGNYGYFRDELYL